VKVSVPEHCGAQFVHLARPPREVDIVWWLTSPHEEFVKPWAPGEGTLQLLRGPTTRIFRIYVQRLVRYLTLGAELWVF